MIGSVVIITVVEYYFSKRVRPTSTFTQLSYYDIVIAVVFLAVLYNYFADFYSASARELKRIGTYFITFNLCT